jgi:opacity protein-like surface antigen
MMKKLMFICWVITSMPIFGQNADIAYDVFSDTRIITSQSVETNLQGEGTFIISHRFGDIYQGGASSVLYNFFGFDGGANMRIGLDYGIKDWLMIGGGRSGYNKTYDAFVKSKVLQQQKGDKNMPVTVTLYADVSFISDTTNAILDSFFVDRFSYAYQLMIARKFNDMLSVQLMPTLIHRNLVATNEESNDVFAIGAALKYNVTPTLALSGEYFYNLPGQLPEGYNDYMGLGIDIKTKGHVFQIQLTNSPFLIPEYYIGATQGSIIDEDSNGNFDLNLRLGFNITRDFQLGGRQY